jgi:glycerophosphoryl diester phosphodiesterase
VNPRHAAPDWLVLRPIAHRGLHDRTAARIENAPSAALAAIRHGFAIECDVQLTADGDAVVFHDFTLDRLTGTSGAVADRRASELTETTLRDSSDRIPTLAALLDLIGGRVPLICEIKSRFDGDMRLADRVAEIARAHGGPLALKSFDPAVVTHLRRHALPCPLGIVGEAEYTAPEWNALSPERKRDMAEMLHFGETRPDFLSYRVADLPHAVPFLCRTAIGLPVMTWTVRTEEQRHRAAIWADQMVFEGFVP